MIAIRWNDATRTLALGARQGSYRGMAPGHTFDVAVVRPGHGVGEDTTAAPDRTLYYTGTKIHAKF